MKGNGILVGKFKKMAWNGNFYMGMGESQPLFCTLYTVMNLEKQWQVKECNMIR